MSKQLPRTFLFLGRRLIRELYSQLEAKRPRWKLNEMQFKPPVLPLEASFTKTQPSEENWYWMAERVTEALEEDTGTVLDPGLYVRAEMTIAWGAVSGWIDPGEVAWFFGQAETEEGLAYVTLFGSVENFNGYRPKSPGTWSGWTPSSDKGIQDAIRSLSPDVGTAGRRLQVGAESRQVPRRPLRGSEVSRIQLSENLENSLRASQILLNSGYADGLSTKETLFRVADYIPCSRETPCIFLGTPIWVADPLPGPFVR